MVTIHIGQASSALQDADESWIAQQVNRRRDDGHVVCVQLVFKESDIDVGFSTPGCGGGGSLGRPLNAKEQRILDLWRKHGLDRPDFTGGNVVAFVKQLRGIT
jgi:hypothetical protein